MLHHIELSILFIPFLFQVCNILIDWNSRLRPSWVYLWRTTNDVLVRIFLSFWWHTINKLQNFGSCYKQSTYFHLLDHLQVTVNQPKYIEYLQSVFNIMEQDFVNLFYFIFTFASLDEFFARKLIISSIELKARQIY